MDTNWKILYDFTLLQQVNNYIFADKESLSNIIGDLDNEALLVININDCIDDVIKEIDCELVYQSENNYFYKVLTSY